jgi:hypothetical protein
MLNDHREFYELDLENGWETPPGYPEGFQTKILASSLDEEAKTGHRSRFMRIAPGAYTTAPFTHDHWEEVFLFSGDLIVGCDENGEGGEMFNAPTFAVRPPHFPHGPFTSRAGCIMFELHYYAEAKP